RLLGQLLADDAARCSGSTITETFEASLEPGQRAGIEKYVVWAWDHEPPDSDDSALLAELGKRRTEAAEQGFEALAIGQTENIQAFWRVASVTIDGDPDALRALRLNLFHLFQSSTRSADHGTAAKGLTGDGYEGHCFWDSESFMVPVLALIAPDLARTALEFRYRTLERARNHAREMNHPRGALYPWRTIAGDECSGHYPSGSAQYHINAAIAYAVRVYEAGTSDADFMAGAGVEMLVETARIWMDMGQFNELRQGRFCICEVTGPDEYSALVDNNYYTNKMARAHLLHAVQAWHRLERERPETARNLAERLGLEAGEIETWQRAGEAMYLPWDERLGIHPQADGFLDKPAWDFERGDQTRRPLLLDYHPLTLFRHQVCKQADVVQALVMDGLDVDPEIKRRCFDYYASITTHDSTLSAAPFSILAAELDRAEPALAWFDETLRVDLDNLHGNSGHGAHMAAMAGSWQCLAFGFAGLRIDGTRLRFAPVIPARWRSWQLAIVWRGRHIALGADPQHAWFRLESGPALEIECHGETLRLEPARTTAIDLPQSARWLLVETAVPIE
ncbi:MAG: glycosyl hydrolase family 65 protein, partial [Wenzhouxiangellaceae bacterium]